MFNTAVKKDKLEAYLKYHRAVWPEVIFHAEIHGHGLRMKKKLTG
jgi:L-rhamnose mutarotase